MKEPQGNQRSRGKDKDKDVQLTELSSMKQIVFKKPHVLCKASVTVKLSTKSAASYILPQTEEIFQQLKFRSLSSVH